MKHRFYTYIILLLLLVITFSGIATAKKFYVKDVGSVATYAPKIKLRPVTEQTLKKLHKDPHLNYYRGEPAPTLIDKILSWIDDKLRRFFSWSNEHHVISNILKYTLYAMLLFAVYIIVTKLLKSDKQGLFSKKKQHSGTNLLDINDLENIHNIDFEELLKKYITEKNYKFAIRVYYSKLLKTMTDLKIIKWQKKKTNSDYIQEVTDTKLQQPFKDITRSFEYSWYGNFPVSVETFNSVQQEIINFRQHLQQDQ